MPSQGVTELTKKYMRKKSKQILGVALVAIGIMTFAISWEKILSLFLLAWQPTELGLERHFATGAQGLFYFTLSTVMVLFGILLILTRHEQIIRLGQRSLFVMLVIWIILEIPIYKCVFYNVNHSFWDSKNVHFH